MKIESDDPRLTAHALGELDETERAALEAALENSPEARAALEEIREAAALLGKELAAEPLAAASLRSSAGPAAQAGTEIQSGKIVRFPWRRLLVWGSLAAAACFLVILQLPEHFAPAENFQGRELTS